MNYFFKGLRDGNKKYWAGVGVAAVWFVAFIDILSTAVKPPGLMNGKFFTVTLILTVAAPVVYYVYSTVKAKKEKKETRLMEEEAALFEPRREQEIRRILAENPEFVTLCYQCIHFDPRLRHCAKALSDDIAYKRVKEVRINNRKYCLYWEEAPGSL